MFDRRKLSGVVRRVERWRKRQTSHINLSLSLTRVCNARCNMCLMFKGNSSTEHMSDAVLERSIEVIKKVGNRYVPVHSMGECLAHPKFGEYVERLLKEHCYVSVSTNGSLMNRWMDDLLKVNFLRVSLEGWDRDSMTYYRRQNFDKVYNNIKTFRELSKGRVPYSFDLFMHVYPSMTEENVRKMVEVWGPFFDHILVGFPYNPDLNHQHAWAPELEQSGDYHTLVPRPGKKHCSLPYENSYIQPNGDVLACCHDYPGRLILGNIMQDDFLDIFYGEKALRLRREFEDGNPVSCGNCCSFYQFPDEIVQKENAIKVLVKNLHDEVKR